MCNDSEHLEQPALDMGNCVAVVASSKATIISAAIKRELLLHYH